MYAMSAGLQPHAREPSALQLQQPAPLQQSGGADASLAAAAAFQLLWPLAHYQQSGLPDCPAEEAPTSGKHAFGAVEIMRSAEEPGLVPCHVEGNNLDQQAGPEAAVEGEAGKGLSAAEAADGQQPLAGEAEAGTVEPPDQPEQSMAVAVSFQPAAAGPVEVQLTAGGSSAEPSPAQQGEGAATTPAQLCLQAADAAEHQPPLSTTPPRLLSSTASTTAEAAAPSSHTLSVAHHETADPAVPSSRTEALGMPEEARGEASALISTSAAPTERPMLQLPGSRSEQKRVRQAEAAARQLQQQQQQQVLPQKRGWEEWLQGAAEPRMHPPAGVGPCMHVHQEQGRRPEAGGRAGPRGRSRGQTGGAVVRGRGKGRGAGSLRGGRDS